MLTQRIARQGFVDRPASSAADAARLTGGLQAQDPQASRLGVRSRAQDLTEADVLRAIEVERSAVRTWLMRATIHLVAADDVVWMTRLLGPAIARKFRKRWLDLGLTDDVLARAVAALPEILAGGPRTRHQVVAALAWTSTAAPATRSATSHQGAACDCCRSSTTTSSATASVTCSLTRQTGRTSTPAASSDRPCYSTGG